MEKIVMQGKTMIQGVPVSSMIGLLGQISMDTSSIGYTVYYYSSTMVPMERIKRVLINGVEASPATIAAGQYKFSSPVYAVIRSNLDKNSNAYLFWRWLRTASGQAAIEHSGYVAYAK
jgi:phosphate transport system substrate-binding protein